MLSTQKSDKMATIKISYKSKELQKNFYVMNTTDSWVHLVQLVEANIKDVDINKLRKFWIGELLFFHQIRSC